MKTLRLLTIALCFSSIACAGANHGLRNTYPALIPIEESTVVKRNDDSQSRATEVASRMNVTLSHSEQKPSPTTF